MAIEVLLCSLAVAQFWQWGTQDTISTDRQVPMPRHGRLSRSRLLEKIGLWWMSRRSKTWKQQQQQLIYLKYMVYVGLQMTACVGTSYTECVGTHFSVCMACIWIWIIRRCGFQRRSKTFSSNWQYDFLQHGFFPSSTSAAPAYCVRVRAWMKMTPNE